MTAAAEAGMADRTAEAVALARDVSAQLAEVRALVAEAARQAELAVARGTSGKAVAYWLIDASRLIVSWPRAESRVTP